MPLKLANEKILEHNVADLSDDSLLLAQTDLEVQPSKKPKTYLSATTNLPPMSFSQISTPNGSNCTLSLTQPKTPILNQCKAKPYPTRGSFKDEHH